MISPPLNVNINMHLNNRDCLVFIHFFSVFSQIGTSQWDCGFSLLLQTIGTSLSVPVPSNFLPLLTSFSSKTTPHLNTRAHKKHRLFVITQNRSFRFPTIWHSRITRRHVGPFHLQCLARTNPVTGPSAPWNRPPNYTCPPPCSIQQLLGSPLVRRSVPRGLSYVAKPRDERACL